ncbi:MAG TPA: tetratricopeptide repeat protein [Kutzneria sp.]
MGEDLGDALRRRRLRAGLTQEELAERSGVSVRTIRGLETGSRPNPRHTSLRQLAQALGVDRLDTDVTRPVPRQLPPAPHGFAGREAALAELDTATIALVVGPGGIGKTSLAVHWAHERQDRFPDGQLFVDLRGCSPDGEAVRPLTALRGFLDALGVDTGRLNGTLADHTALYRSVIADRRMLIVLDNAASGDQIEPLLPGTAACTALITSRRKLTAVVTRYGSQVVTLPALEDDEAKVLLMRRLDERRAAPDAVTREIIARCGGYPLALAIVASRARGHPDIPLAEFVAELRDLGLEALDGDDPSDSLPQVLSWSLRRLTAEQRTVFSLLGIAPGADIGLPAAASLTGLPHVKQVLRELVDASLLNRWPGERYSMHDLVRAFAVTIVGDEGETALRRVVDFYAGTAHAADRLLAPQRPPSRIPPPTTDVVEPPSALDWFDAEHANLIAAQHVAVDHGWADVAWQLAWSMSIAHLRRGRLHDQLTVWQAALHADPVCLAIAHRHLGRALTELGRHEVGLTHLREALALTELHGDQAEQGHTHRVVARAWALRDEDRRAYDHADRAAELYRALGRTEWLADAMNQLGWFAVRLGDHDTARAQCEAALALHEEIGNVEGRATTLDSLGFIAHSAGRHHDAISCYRQALALYQTLGNTYDYANTAQRLGHPHATLGAVAEARATWQEALALYQDQGRHEAADRVRSQLDELLTASRR